MVTDNVVVLERHGMSRLTSDYAASADGTNRVLAPQITILEDAFRMHAPGDVAVIAIERSEFGIIGAILANA